MWKIESKKSIGPLYIGEKIYNLKEKLGDSFDTFKRVTDTEDTVYAFDKHGVHLTCGNDEIVKIISVFHPNKVLFSDIQLIGKTIEAVRTELIANRIVAIEQDAGLWIEEAGIILVVIDGNVDGIELYSD